VAIVLFSFSKKWLGLDSPVFLAEKKRNLKFSREIDSFFHVDNLWKTPANSTNFHRPSR